MLQYRIYVNGVAQGALSEDEYKSIRKEVRRDYRNWIAACLSELSVFPYIFGHLVKGLTVVGALGFIFALLYAPQVATDFINLTPEDAANNLRGYGKLLVTVGVMCAVLTTLFFGFLKFNDSKPGTFDNAIIEKLRHAHGINQFSIIALDAEVKAEQVEQEQN